MSEAAARYWAARCQRGDPPQPGSPCAALLWAVGEVERMTRLARHVAEHDPDPAAAGAALRILREDKS